MTCVIGLEHEGEVWVGADSGAYDPDTLEMNSRLDEKVFLLGELVVGFCGSFRVGQLVRYAFNPPDQRVGQDDMAYMVTDFIDGLRGVLKDRGALKKEDDLEESDIGLLVGFNGRLYVIDADFQVARCAEDYATMGTAGSVARGALAATRDLGWSPAKRIDVALNAARIHSAGICAPFHVVKLDAPGKEEGE